MGFSYYLATVATWGLLYGSLGSVLAFLLVVYLQVAVLLFGGELAAAWSRDTVPAEPDAEEGVPMGRRLLGVVRGLFVR